MKRLQTEAEDQQEKLITIAETLEQWKECQRNWLYLENIFSSAEIKRQRPKDYSDFEHINRNWVKLMKGVNQKKRVSF